MTSKFKVGDKIYIAAEIVEVDPADKGLPLKINHGIGWARGGEHVIHAADLAPTERTITFSSPEILAETAAATELRARLRSIADLLGEDRMHAADGCHGRAVADLLGAFLSEREVTHRICAQAETLGAELKAARTEVARLRTLEPTFQEYQASKRDRRILDCMQTLLAMREAP